MGVGGIIGLEAAQPLPVGDSAGDFSPIGTSTKNLMGTISIWAGNVALRQVNQGGGGTIIVVTPASVFILRGFYTGTGQYEFWNGPSRNTPPPSGHQLQGTTVIGEMPQTGIY